jgi:hypothetical protein
MVVMAGPAMNRTSSSDDSRENAVLRASSSRTMWTQRDRVYVEMLPLAANQGAHARSIHSG